LLPLALSRTTASHDSQGRCPKDSNALHRRLPDFVTTPIHAGNHLDAIRYNEDGYTAGTSQPNTDRKRISKNMRKTGDIEAYAKIIDTVRQKIVASIGVVDKIREEVKAGTRDPESDLEVAEVQHLKELRGALILHLHSLNEMLGNS
jgi:hypothetical protein